MDPQKLHPVMVARYILIRMCVHVCTCAAGLIVDMHVKAGSQYDAGRCVTSRHASLKRCRNAT